MAERVITDSSGTARCRVDVRGTVQGVGFRPFVYRLADELGLRGWVRNVAGMVEIEVSGSEPRIDELVVRLRSDAPPLARIEAVEVRQLVPSQGAGPTDFLVLDSRHDSVGGQRWFPPDVATCDDCIRELFDPADRRYRYPFTNCTNCGPRATIIDDLPYDRTRTAMAAFPLCPDCTGDYENPGNRRFHAEPVACPACGPELAYRPGADYEETARGEDALAAALTALGAGRIVALKGLGGYQLACDATNELAVRRLRERKRRWAKPLAVMVRDARMARNLADMSEADLRLLMSPARPIVLITAAHEAALADSVRVGNRRIGLFLPYTPLHHLLLHDFDRPIVLTSGNLSDEPIAIDDQDARERLRGIADSFLTHNRAIRARYDDSVVHVVGNRSAMIRCARGYAPTPLSLPLPAAEPLLAVGAQLKHTFALASGDKAWIGPHTGDLEDAATNDAFLWNLRHLARLQALEPAVVAHDLHPGYLSTQYAAAAFPENRRMPVQHHHAHVASCAAEHGLAGDVIGVAYDGTGLGDDGTLWGGEILIANMRGYRRFARFGLAPMPGGSGAIKKPYRMALGYLLGAEGLPSDTGSLLERVGDAASEFLDRIDPREIEVIRTQVNRRLNTPLTSSAGRLFDAAASLLGLCDIAGYEAEAAIALDNTADPREHGELPWRLRRADDVWIYDPRPTLEALVEDHAAGTDASALAARFQRTIAAATVALCSEARKQLGLASVCLSGGVMQNKWLVEYLERSLAREGFEVYVNRQIPANDGGISYGQAAVAAARSREG